MELDTLNDDCLRLIFGRVTIVELIHLRGVCVRWKALAETVLHSRRSVKLFSNFKSVLQYISQLVQYNIQHDRFYRIGYGELVGNDWGDGPDGFSHQTDWTEPDKCDFLRLIFPSLTTLVLHLSYSRNSTSLEYLLDQFPCLQQLSVFNIASGVKLLSVSSTNKLSQLKRLELCNFNLRDINVTHLGAVMPQLEHFTLGFCYQSLSDPTDYITPMLIALDKCRRLTLNKVHFTDEMFRHFVQSKPELVASLTHLTINTGKTFRYGTSHELVELICDNFSSLTYLNMYPSSGISLESLTNSLFRLTHLTSLHLFINFRNLVTLHPDSPFQPQTNRTLRHLSLTMPSTINIDLIERIFPVAFPSLTQLTLDHSSMAPVNVNLSRFGQLTSTLIYDRNNEQCYFDHSPSSFDLLLDQLCLCIRSNDRWSVMAMYNNAECCDLVNKLICDPNWYTTFDRFEWMQYAVARYDKQLTRYATRITEQCVQYEQVHGKPQAIAQYHQMMSRLALDKYHKRRQDEDEYSEEEYAELVAVCNSALRYSPVKWQDWPSLLTIFELYVNRAAVHYDFGSFPLAVSDLRHANSVLVYVQKPEQICEMRDHFQFQDQGLLIAMVSLQMKLLEKLDRCPGDVIQDVLRRHQLAPIDPQQGFESREELEAALETIKMVDSIFETYDEAIRLEQTGQWKLLGSVNYQLTEKVRVDNTPHGGRTFKSTEHIEQGEDILQERCLAGVVFRDHVMHVCNYCLRSVDTFWPCGTCSEVVYCSARCSMLAYAEYHRFECGLYGFLLGQENFYALVHTFRWCATFGVDKTIRYEEMQDAANKTGQQFNMAEYLESEAIRTEPFRKLHREDKSVVGRAVSSLVSHRGKRSIVREENHTVLALGLVQCLIHRGLVKKDLMDNVQELARLVEHLATIMLRFCTNGFCWSQDGETVDGVTSVAKVASCVCFVGSMINHSCVPNVNWNITSGGILRLSALQPIKPGEPLNLCYGPSWTLKFSERQERLVTDYCFYCQCEACMTDSASAADTLRCISPGGQCSGPLVLNHFEACLKCGYTLPASQHAPTLRKWKQLANKSSDQFMQTEAKMHKKDSWFRKLFNRIFGHDKEMLKGSQDDNSRLMQSISANELHQTVLPFNPSQMSLQRIDKLEKHFQKYSSIVYGSSHHLLEKCAILLKVYHEKGIDKWGLRLIDHLNKCLDVVYPQMIDLSLVSRLYQIDYCAYFFDQLVEKEGDNIAKMMANVCQMDSIELDQLHTMVCSLVERLNAKVVDILQYDMLHRGQLFPLLHRQLLDAASNDNLKEPLEDIQASEPDSEEMYFRNMHIEAQRRLSVIEKMSLKKRQ